MNAEVGDGFGGQVRNLTGCIKVALDFVAPESAAQCMHLADELRVLALAEVCCTALACAPDGMRHSWQGAKSAAMQICLTSLTSHYRTSSQIECY